MKNIFKTSFHFVFLIIPLLILGACAKDVGGPTQKFIPDDPFFELSDSPPSSDMVGTWAISGTVTEADCPGLNEGDTISYDLVIYSDGSCNIDESSSVDDCKASEDKIVVYAQQDYESTNCIITFEEVDSLTLDSISGNLTGESKIEYTSSDGCGSRSISCQIITSLEGTLDDDGTTGGSTTSGSTGSGTGSTTGEGSGSGGSSGGSSGTGSGGESGGSSTGDGTEASTITVTSSQIIKDTLNATVEITNNTSVSSLIVKVLLQKSILTTGGITNPGAFGTRNAVLGPKTLTIESGTTETKTLKFTIPENLSGTYTARIVLQYVDEEGVTQTLDTDLIRSLEIE